MDRWTGVVVALRGPGEDQMASRLPACLHPIAGRALVWHTACLLSGLRPAPDRVVVVTELDLRDEQFADLPVPVEVMGREQVAALSWAGGGQALVMDAAASASAGAVQLLVGSAVGTWLRAGADEALAVWVDAKELGAETLGAEPLRVPSALVRPALALSEQFWGTVVRDRVQLAQASRRVRDRLVHALMQEGTTFLLPESVLVDVDVRIGRDSVVYPGVVLEGQTTIGDETVVGPGCRIIDSWIGSGVELKGWNYVSHTSIRNRAILEPYVRRGFD